MNKSQYLIAIFVLIVASLGWKGFSLYQATLPNAISQWDLANENNPREIDHSLWQQILTKYVQLNADNSHGFDYGNVSLSDQNKLSQYLTQLQKIEPRDYRKNEQLAYWVNLYNALIVDLVLSHYPLDSIKEIGDGFTGPWNIELATVANSPVSLNNIEHGILRALWQDKRLHYVLNCASIGCPDLGKKPFTSKHIDRQLDTAAIRFINQSKGVKLSNNKLVLSSIYDWFSVDFGTDQKALLQHLIWYAKPKLKQQLNDFEGNAQFSYQWKLNNTSTGLMRNDISLNIQPKKSS